MSVRAPASSTSSHLRCAEYVTPTCGAVLVALKSFVQNDSHATTIVLSCREVAWQFACHQPRFAKIVEYHLRFFFDLLGFFSLLVFTEAFFTEFGAGGSVDEVSLFRKGSILSRSAPRTSMPLTFTLM
jgi:hypothetical protein